MSQTMAQSDGESVTVEEGDLISEGPGNLQVHAVDGPLVPEDEIVVERSDGHRMPAKRDEIARCDCGMLVFGEGPCYGCFKTNGGE